MTALRSRGGRKSRAATPARQSAWLEYERRKRALPPGLTPAQYAAACRAIAAKLCI